MTLRQSVPELPLSLVHTLSQREAAMAKNSEKKTKP
jgi:hypothetical protein